ncbi:MAG: glycosyltransferase family 2 protein [Spirochaetaceae bacterium]
MLSDTGLNKEPKVSIIIGTYKREKVFMRSINSVLKQTYENLEIILVNDASPDNTKIKMDEIKDKRVICIHHDTNKGIAVVSNTGFKHSTGEYIALLGDDDEWTDPDRLKKQIEVFNSSSESDNIGIVGAWWKSFDGKNYTEDKPVLPNNLIEKMLSGGGVIGGSVCLIPRKCWLEVGGFDEKQLRGTDSDLFRRIVFQGYNIHIIPEFFAKIYVGTANERMTGKHSVLSINRHISAMEYNLEKFNDLYSIYDKAKCIYLEKLGHLYFKKNRISKDKQDKINSINYIKASLKLGGFKLKLVIKFIYYALF